MQIRFVQLHNHCAEYLTSDDVRVFDHREKKDDDTSLPMWSVALRNYVAFLVEEWCTNHEQDEVERFAWSTLYDFASDEVNNREDKFAWGYKALIGSEYIPAKIIFSSGHPEMRTAFRDHRWDGHDRFYFCENVLNPNYVIIRD